MVADMGIEFNDDQIEQLKQRTKDSGYKTRFIAEKMGIHPSTLTRFLNQGQRLGNPALLLLMQFLKLNADDLEKKAS